MFTLAMNNLLICKSESFCKSKNTNVYLEKITEEQCERWIK